MHRLIWMVVVLLAGSSYAWAMNEFVQITSYRANIRSQPRTSSGIVTTAHRGDIFFLKGEEQGWYRIHLLSGEPRYIHKSLAKKVSHSPQLPASISTRRELFQSFQEMEYRIRREADEKYPPDKRLERNLALQQSLKDRYGLELLHQFKVLATVYRSIMIEGTRSNW